MLSPRRARAGFTLIELLVVIAIIAILAVVVVLTLNPAELLRQSRDANRVSDMATLTSALNLYTTDQSVAPTFSLGNASNTYVSIYDPAATSTNACPSLSLPTLNASSAQAYQCSASSTYRTIASAGWIPVNLSNLTSGSPIGNLPVDPTNQTSTGLFYAYNTNGTQFEVTSGLESSKYKTTYANNPQTSYFPDVISGGTQNISALYSNSGLVGYWPLNEGLGSSTIDQSGNGDNGTWHGASGGIGNTHYSSGKIGPYAGYFDGTSNYVDVGNPATLQITNAITIALWIDPSSLPTFTALIGNFEGGSQNNGAFVLRQNGGNIIAAFYFSSGATLQMAQSFNTTNAWSNFVITYNGSRGVVYLNGASFVTGNATGTITYSQGYDWVIGGNYPNAAGVPGSINDVRIYNRALSAAEVKALYNAEK